MVEEVGEFETVRATCDVALVCMLGLLGLRIFDATAASITDLGEEHGHRVLKVHGKGDKTVLVPLPPAVARAIGRAVGDAGPAVTNPDRTHLPPHTASTATFEPQTPRPKTRQRQTPDCMRQVRTQRASRGCAWACMRTVGRARQDPVLSHAYRGPSAP